MECSLGYAVVLDSEGRFLKVPNLGYEVGQTLDHVVVFEPPSQNKAYKKRFARWAALAACVCLVIMSGLVWQTPMGTVRMQINPDVRMSVNCFGRVVGLDGLNEDGQDLIEGYHSYGKTARAVSYGLARHAVEMGYLSDGGQIVLTVESKQSEWKTATEEMLLSELGDQFDHRIAVTTVAVGSGDETDVPPAPVTAAPSGDLPPERDDVGEEQEEELERDDDIDTDDDIDSDDDPDEDPDDDDGGRTGQSAAPNGGDDRDKPEDDSDDEDDNGYADNSDDNDDLPDDAEEEDDDEDEDDGEEE